MPDITITISDAALARMENAFGATGSDLKEKVKHTIKRRIETLEQYNANKTALENLNEFTFEDE